MAIQMDQSISLGSREASPPGPLRLRILSLQFERSEETTRIQNSKSEKKTSLRAKTIDGEVKEFYEVFAP